MKKLFVVLPLVLVLLALTLPIVGAAMDDEDPKLCVEGQWLLVVAASPTAVTVYVPEDARYGDALQGGCSTPGPNAPLITAVKERGRGRVMLVQVDGKQASRPKVTATYGAAALTRQNNGHGMVNFTFFVH